MRMLTILATLSATIVMAPVARAGSLGRPCTSVPPARWLSLEALRSRVEALGYTVRRGKIRKACGEFYATDSTGTRIELFIDPSSGAVVGKM